MRAEWGGVGVDGVRADGVRERQIKISIYPPRFALVLSSEILINNAD